MNKISDLVNGFINYEKTSSTINSKLNKSQQTLKQCCLDIASRQVTIGSTSSLIQFRYKNKIRITAAENGDTNCLEDFLTKNPYEIDKVYDFAQNKYTLLHIALICNQFNTVKYLVEKGASLDIYPNLFMTSCNTDGNSTNKDTDRSDIVHYLLAQGVKLPENCDYMIHCCVFHNKINTFKTLVDHGIKPTSSTDMLDIQLYFKPNRIKYLRYLLENNLKVDAEYNGLQLIHIACIPPNSIPFSPSIEVIKLLLKYGANINAQSKLGKATPLHFLLANKHISDVFPVLQFLVQNGAKESLLGKINFPYKDRISNHAEKIINERNNKYKAIDLVPDEYKRSAQEIIQHHRQEYLNNKPTNKQSLVSKLKDKFKELSATPLEYQTTVPSAPPFEYLYPVPSAPPFEDLYPVPSAPPFEYRATVPSVLPFESLENVVLLDIA